jgi:hypothetical protein
MTWVDSGGHELHEAELGNLGPLRQKYPDIARYINMPTRGRGEYRRPVKIDDVDLAVRDAFWMRDIWRHFYRKHNRPKGQISAEEIAAQRRGVRDPQAVIERAKEYSAAGRPPSSPKPNRGDRLDIGHLFFRSKSSI